jgi:hypothetical protein
VGAEVVHDHDVARALGRRQSLLDIGQKAGAVDRARRARSGGRDGARLGRAWSSSGHGARRRPPGCRAGRGPSGAPCRWSPRSRRGTPGAWESGLLPLAPGAARGGDVRAVLLGRVPDLFFASDRRRSGNGPSADRLVAMPAAASRRRSSAIVRSRGRPRPAPAPARHGWQAASAGHRRAGPAGPCRAGASAAQA